MREVLSYAVPLAVLGAGWLAALVPDDGRPQPDHAHGLLVADGVVQAVLALPPTLVAVAAALTVVERRGGSTPVRRTLLIVAAAVLATLACRSAVAALFLVEHDPDPLWTAGALLRIDVPVAAAVTVLLGRRAALTATTPG